MQKAALGFALLGGLLFSCRTPNSTEAPASSAAPTADAAASGAPALPPVERSCTRDDECAVAKIEVSGPGACCAACGTTPGTRRWHAALQRYCAAHPPASCPPLACPMGPTRAICRAGRCESTATGSDGGPTFLLDDRRCLPATVCYDWAGCALVAGNSQDGWFVEESDRVARGEVASVEVIRTADAGSHEAAKLFPQDVICPPSTVPPRIGPPPSACVLEGLHCRPAAGR